MNFYGEWKYYILFILASKCIKMPTKSGERGRKIYLFLCYLRAFALKNYPDWFRSFLLVSSTNIVNGFKILKELCGGKENFLGVKRKKSMTPLVDCPHKIMFYETISLPTFTTINFTLSFPLLIFFCSFFFASPQTVKRKCSTNDRFSGRKVSAFNFLSINLNCFFVNFS